MMTLHAKVARDILSLLNESYSVKSLGVGDGKEIELKGRYFNKKVDLAFCKNDVPIAGLGIKMVMQNYSQNSNNYFENMMGKQLI